MALQEGSVVVVTGAASGIGEGLARECSERGFRLALADIEGPALDSLARELEAGGAVVTAVPTDVSEPSSVAAFATQVERDFGVPALVLANAGVIGPALPLWQQPATEWEWTWRVNVLGVVNTWSAFLPAMIDRGTGHVAATSSVAGLAPGQSAGNAPYAASKYGIVALADNLRVELAEVAPDLLVTVLLPGPVKSRIRQATRNRPPEFGGPETQPMPAVDPFPTRLEADEFALSAMDGLQQGVRYLMPNADFVEPVAQHVERVAAELRRDNSWNPGVRDPGSRG
ncbi:MAG: SDR family NAD(P)-dependent oxidoreductase [Acidimicrobiales bacterium]